MNRLTPVSESRFGLYVWMMPDGRVVADQDLNWLNIPSVRGDQDKIDRLTKTVRHYGIEEGTPIFLEGRRRVTDEELEEQQMRLRLGLTPDPYDAAALMDELRANGEYRG